MCQQNINSLESLRDNTNDLKIELFVDWMSAIIYLQRGVLSNNLDDRKQKFEVASKKMENIFEKVYSFENPILPKPRKYYLSSEEANVIYYTAKAMWSRYFLVRNKTKLQDQEIFCARLFTVLQMSLQVFYRRQGEYFSDKFIEAIYLFCVALIIVVIETINNDYPNFKFDEKIFSNKNLAKISYWVDVKQKNINKCKSLIKNLEASPQEDRILNTIYNEFTEKLDSLKHFKNAVNILDKWSQDKNKNDIIEFYTLSKSFSDILEEYNSN